MFFCFPSEIHSSGLGLSLKLFVVHVSHHMLKFSNSNSTVHNRIRDDGSNKQYGDGVNGVGGKAPILDWFYFIFSMKKNRFYFILRRLFFLMNDSRNFIKKDRRKSRVSHSFIKVTTKKLRIVESHFLLFLFLFMLPPEV